ncbi:MAG: hypothetical protein WCO71_05855 [Pseudomonadota bacterium]
MGQPDKQYSPQIQPRINAAKQFRVSGRVGATPTTATEVTDKPTDIPNAEEILRIYSTLREFHDRDGSELCKALDYSLKIFGRPDDESVTIDRLFRKLLPKKKVTDRN